MLSSMMARHETALVHKDVACKGSFRNLAKATLVAVQGTVTQVTDVKPLLTVATYLDRNQATEAYQEVTGESCIAANPINDAHTHFLKAGAKLYSGE